MMQETKVKTKEVKNMPMQCKSGVDIWREVDHIAGEKGALVTKWVNVLQDEDIVSEDDVVPFRVTGISYGSMNCGIQSMTEDRIVLSRQFLEDTDLQADAVKEIARIDEIAKAVYGFGNDCSQCMNFDKKDKRIGRQLSDQYYGAIGQAFRAYLAGELSVQDLRNAEFDCARNVSNQFVEQNIKALLRGKPGENEMYLGKAEKNLGIHLAKIKRKLNG